ncbi:hypothetical protein TNCV_2772881 [Trichonephila clavipes]|nr:hypothetical protein TNCV_2772881 [Trichonephila clavipes]
MHVSNTSTLSLEKTALLDKLHELEESNLEKVDKLVKLEEKFACNILDFLSCGQGWPTVKLKALLQAPLASPKRAMSPTGERRDGTSELPFGPQERQTRIDRAGSKIVAPGNKPLYIRSLMAFRFLAGDVREETDSSAHAFKSL